MSSPATLLHVFPTFAVGGSQMRFAALANHFGARFRHVIVAMDGRRDCRERLRQGLDVAFPDTRFGPRRTLDSIRRFRALLREIAPSRLVTYNWGSIECAMANWPGLVRHVHIEDGFGPEEAGGQIRRRVLTRRYVLARSTVVLPSRRLVRLAGEVWKLDPARLAYIPNGIDCARFAAPGIMPWPVPGEGPVIGTVAALRPEKNMLRLLEAFRLVREKTPCRLLIAGGGPGRAALERHAAELGLQACVVFTGHIAETERAYAAMSVFALSSDTEQMPTAVLEAMAAGLPVAATDVGDVRKMLSDGNGAFVVPRDADALAGALLGLLRNPAQARAIGAANRAAACASFDQEPMFAAYGALFGDG